MYMIIFSYVGNYNLDISVAVTPFNWVKRGLAVSWYFIVKVAGGLFYPVLYQVFADFLKAFMT